MSKQNQGLNEEGLREEYHRAVSEGDSKKAIELGDRLYDYHLKMYERCLASLREMEAELGKDYSADKLEGIRGFRDKLEGILEGYVADLNESFEFLIGLKSRQIFHNL